MKQFTAWKVRQLGGGILQWTSPLGRIYIEEPPSPGVRFGPPPGVDDEAPDDPPDDPGSAGELHDAPF